MHEIARLAASSDAIELDFVEREATPEFAMQLGIRAHLTGQSLSNTVRLLTFLGVDRCRTTVHNWVKKVDLESAGGYAPAHIALDETVIKVNGEPFWIYTAVDTATNRILHRRLYMTRGFAVTAKFLRELEEKRDIDDAEFLVDGAKWIHAGLHELGMHFRHETLSNGCFRR